MLTKKQIVTITVAFVASCIIAETPLKARIHGGIAPSGGGGGDVFLTNATVVEPSGNNQTNEVVTFGLPLQPGLMTAGKSLKVVDNDTSSQISCEDDNQTSDIANGVRFETPTCIIPSHNASATKSLSLYVTSGSPPTGTDITVSDITAAFTAASSYDVVATFTDINGVSGTWTASLATALASGNASFVNSTTNAVIGKFRSGGGLATEYVVLAPAFKSGVADPQVHVVFDVLCYKANRAAVNSSTNPILKCRTDAIVEDSWLQASSPVDNWYGFQLTSGGSTVASWPVSTPTQTLTGLGYTINAVTTGSPGTLQSAGVAPHCHARDDSFYISSTGTLPAPLTANTLYYAVNINCPGPQNNETFQVATSSGGTPIAITSAGSGTITASMSMSDVPVVASSGLFTADYQGRVISDGYGLAVINGYTDSTHVTANIFRPFRTTSVTSGNYKLYGISHSYGARYHVRSWFNAPNAQPEVDKGTLYLGNAWNNGTLTGGPGSYVIGSMIIPNYNWNMTMANFDLSYINALGTTPMAYNFCGASYGRGGNMANLQCYMETSGQRPDIGIIPDWEIAALIRYNSNAATMIFTNAERWQSFGNVYRDQNTGKNLTPCNAGTLPNCTSSVQYVNDGRFAGTAIAIPVNGTTPWSGDGIAHDPQVFLTASLLTGDFYWVEGLQGEEAAAPMNMNQGGTVGVNRTQFMPPYNCCGLQERGVAWSLRNIADSALMTPDSSPGALGITKAVATAHINAQWDAATYGAKVLFLDNTSAGTGFWGSDGPHYTVINDQTNAYSAFQTAYQSFAAAHMREEGMLNTNGIAMSNWWFGNQVNMINDYASVGLENALTYEYGGIFDYSTSCSSPTRTTTWANSYKATSAANSFQYPVGNARRLYNTNTVTLSATSGTNVTVTISGTGGTNNWLGGGSWYVGQWFSVNSDASNGGLGGATGMGKITSVISPTQFTIDTTVTQQFFQSYSCWTFGNTAFNTTSYAGNYMYLPGLLTGDTASSDYSTFFDAATGSEYVELQQVGALYGYQFGLTGGSTAYTRAIGLSGSQLMYAWPKWYVAPR